MKSWKKSIFSVSLLLIAVLSSCEKDQVVYDYRDDYIGEYTMIYDYSFTILGGATTDTTIQYTGTIDYGEEGNIKIEWYDGDIYEFTVSNEGKLSKCNKEIGAISTTEFNLSYTDDLCSPGPMGANYTINLHGDKN